MEPDEQIKVICRSVFKNGDNTISKNQFTQKWIELINRQEKNKVTTAAR